MPTVRNTNQISYARVSFVETEGGFAYYVGDILIADLKRTQTKVVLTVCGDHHEFCSIHAGQQFLKKRFKSLPMVAV